METSFLEPSRQSLVAIVQADLVQADIVQADFVQADLVQADLVRRDQRTKPRQVRR